MSQASNKPTGAHRRYLAMIAIAVVALALLAVLPFLLGPKAFGAFVTEGGPVQVLSAAGYLVVVTTILRETDFAWLRRHWYLVLIPLAMCFRELDFHVLFTSKSLTIDDFLVTPDVPAFEKGVAIVIYTTLATAAFLLVYRHGRNFLQSLLRGDPTSIAVLAAMSCAVLSEMLDGIPRKLADFGIDMPLADARAALVIEEVLELGIPVFLAVAAFSAFPRKGRMTAAAAHVHTSEQDGVASRPTL